MKEEGACVPDQNERDQNFGGGGRVGEEGEGSKYAEDDHEKVECFEYSGGGKHVSLFEILVH